MQQTVYRCWLVIERWMKTYYPMGLTSLRPAAESQALTKLTSHFPLLPNVLVESLALHDGEDEPGILYGNYQLLSTEAIIEYWYELIGFCSSNECYFKTSNKKLCGGRLGIGRIPFAVDRVTQSHYLCIDLNPGIEGEIAQIIEVDFDKLTLDLLDDNYSSFLETYANGLHTGRYQVSNQGDQLILNKQIACLFDYNSISSFQLVKSNLGAY